MSSAVPQQVFGRYLDAISHQRWEELPDLYSRNAVVEHPFGSPGHRRIEGREALRRHFATLRDMGLQLRATDIAFHLTLDPEVIVAEFGYQGCNTRTGDEIARRNVFVTTVRGGLIARSRDYQGNA